MSGKASQDLRLTIDCVWRCGICGAVCGEEAITCGSGHLEVDMAACSGCLVCVRACPAGILEEETFA